MTSARQARVSRARFIGKLTGEILKGNVRKHVGKAASARLAPNPGHPIHRGLCIDKAKGLYARGKTDQKTLGEGLGEVEGNGFGFHFCFCVSLGGFRLAGY
jgi:hypothetical protein